MLVPCRNCGNDVGENAETCFNCGTHTPNKAKHTRSKNFYYYMFILIFTGFYYDEVFKNRTEFISNLGTVYLTVLGIVGFWIIFLHFKNAFK